MTVPDTNHAVVVASFTPPDTIAPTTTPTGGGTAWYLGPVTVTLSGVDNAGGQGVAYSEYSLDGGATWVRGTAAVFPVWKRGGGNGVFTLQFRSADKAGNVETPKSVTVKIDNLDPVTKNDAPLAPRTTDTTVHFTPFDAVSGVKETWYSLDGFTAVKGTSVLITAAGHVGRHWIRYWSIDNAGNVEMSRWCSVDIAAAKIGSVARGRPSRSRDPAALSRKCDAEKTRGAEHGAAQVRVAAASTEGEGGGSPAGSRPPRTLVRRRQSDW